MLNGFVLHTNKSHEVTVNNNNKSTEMEMNDKLEFQCSQTKGQFQLNSSAHHTKFGAGQAFWLWPIKANGNLRDNPEGPKGAGGRGRTPYDVTLEPFFTPGRHMCVVEGGFGSCHVTPPPSLPVGITFAAMRLDWPTV